VQGPETRNSLLIRLRDASQEAAWVEFVAIYEPLIYRLARAKGLQHADAQDMSQEVFAVVGGAIGRFDPELKGSFRGWLSRITRNLVINHLSRDQEPRGAGTTDMQLLLQEQPSVDVATETMFQMEQRREVFRWAAENVQAEVQDETWRAFWLTGVEGLGIEEVANLVGKSPGAVRIARCRVLARLQQEVKKFEE